MPHDIFALSIGVTVPFVVICIISFIIRVYARRCIAHSFGKDDWCMVVAFILWLGQQIITYSWSYLGAGKHESEVPTHNIQLMQRYLFAEEFHYLLTQLAIKLSFLLFYLRFLGTTEWRRVIYMVMALVCVQVAGTWVFYGLQCIPIQAYFHPERYPNAHCLNTGIAYYAPSAANVFVDIVIYVLPIRPLLSLQTSRKRKLRMISVMTLGGCTILVSTLRFIVLYQLANDADFTYIFGRVVVVTTIEFVTAIFTANMPAMSTAYQSWTGSSDAGGGWNHELSTPPTSASSAKAKRASSILRPLRRTGASAIPITRNKATIIAGNTDPCGRGFGASLNGSPCSSEVDLVKCPCVVVTSQWEVSEETEAGTSKREISRSPEPLRLRDDV